MIERGILFQLFQLHVARKQVGVLPGAGEGVAHKGRGAVAHPGQGLALGGGEAHGEVQFRAQVGQRINRVGAVAQGAQHDDAVAPIDAGIIGQQLAAGQAVGRTAGGALQLVVGL